MQDSMVAGVLFVLGPVAIGCAQTRAAMTHVLSNWEKTRLPAAG